MAEYPWSKFFWSDWEADQGLRLCSLAAQGLWMRMLCVCARHEPKGYLAINGNPLSVDAIARLAGVTETEAGNLLAELETNGVFSRDRNRRIYSRRMVRDEKRSQEGRKWKKKGLAQASDNNEGNPPPSRGPSRGPSPQKPEARSQKEEDGPKGPLSPGDDGPPSTAPPIDEIAQAVSAYNLTAEAAGWPKVRALSKERRAALRARLAEAGGIEGWHAALAKARASPLCNGQNDRGWVASFDFLTQRKSFTRLMEGNYDERPACNRPSSGRAFGGRDQQPSGLVGAAARSIADRAH